MSANYERIFYRDYEKLQSENERLIEKNRALSKEEKRLRKIYEIERAEVERAKARIKELDEEKREVAAQNEALKKEIARLNGILNLDGTNSGTPTSKTPLNKKKVIPNPRRKTGVKKGGQVGHPKAKSKAFAEDEVTEDAIHGYSECPECGGELKLFSEGNCKDELDYEVVVVKRRHHYPVYECTSCGKRFRQPIPERLNEENQYDAKTQALALSLMNVGNVSMNKVRRIICGLSLGEVNPTEGI